MRLGREPDRRGFTLLELAVLIAVIGLLLLIAVIAIPKLSERQRLDETVVTVEEVADALTAFAAVYGRLPCPDTSVAPNGLEGGAGGCDAGDVVGLVPYRELGLSDPVLDEASLPVRYAVYRNPGEMADLAALPNRFVPTLPGDPATLTSYTGLPNDPMVETPTLGINPTRVEPDVRNDLDFCLALRNAKNADEQGGYDSTGYVNTLDLAGATPAINSAFVLASGGVEDADGSGTDLAFDGVNQDGDPLGFESPARRRRENTPGTAYDDLVFAMPFQLLESRLSCAAITIGVVSAGNVAIAAAHALVQAEDAVWAAELSVTSAEIAVASSAIAVLMGAISIWVAINDLALATAGCVAALPDICAGEPFAIAGLTLAIISEAAAIATVVVSAIALVEANKALQSAKATIPPVYAHAQKARLDALAADARGGQM